ncbi:MAG: hypothetical protein H7318_19840 [Oligoflexus sp.]|nr:hypothetical protein [Oligoflexus sp.]
MTEEMKDDGTVILSNEAPLTIVMKARDTAFACGSPFLWKMVKWDDKEAAPLTALPYSGQGQSSDAVDVPSSGAIVLSATKSPIAGRTIAMQQTITPNAGEDLGTCLCYVHGGFEFTGSVLAGQDIKSMKDSKPGMGPEQMRTILIDGSRDNKTPAALRSLTLEMEKLSDDVHQIESKSTEGISIATDAKWGMGGFLLYKNYQTLAGPQVGQVTFNMRIDIVKAADGEIAEINVMWKGSTIIETKMLKRSDFFADNQYQRFVLDF